MHNIFCHLESTFVFFLFFFSEFKKANLIDLVDEELPYFGLSLVAFESLPPLSLPCWSSISATNFSHSADLSSFFKLSGLVLSDTIRWPTQTACVPMPWAKVGVCFYSIKILLLDFNVKFGTILKSCGKICVPKCCIFAGPFTNDEGEIEDENLDSRCYYC